MEQLYFSDEIQRKLSGIYRSGLTMIEAPAGYGKSTAVRWAMKKLPAEQVRWFTAVSFQQDTSLDWFIRQIGSLDASAGNALRELGFLNRSNVSDAADILSRLSTAEPCYLILDNFQLVGDNWPLPLLQALADRNQDGLHVVLISQNFKKLRAVFESSSGVTSLNSRDFLLGKRDILRYAQQLGLVLNRHQLDAIHRNTEGWAVAVALYLRNLKESPDKLPEFQDMDGLLYEFFWRKVSGREQELLLRAAAFDCIRAEQLPEIAPGQETALKTSWSGRRSCTTTRGPGPAIPMNCCGISCWACWRPCRRISAARSMRWPGRSTAGRGTTKRPWSAFSRRAMTSGCSLASS